ncbi:MAG: putative S-layer protein [Candidatus Woesearchaeota archaeon]
MKGKIFALLFVLIAMTGFAAAVNLEVTSVEINNKNIYETSGSDHSNNYKYERGEELDIDVCVKALDEVQEAQIEADIYGYRYSTKEQDKISDVTNTFDLDEGDNDCFTLGLEVPDKMDVDYYKLRIRVADRDGLSFEKMFQLHIEGADRSSAVQIKDFSIDPEEVVAGRAFTSMVKVKNIGDDDLDDLKITVSVPELNIKASEYMDELEADESKTFEELLLRVPECAKSGDYDVEITVEFDEYEETTATTTVSVKKGDMCGASGDPVSGEDLTTITVPNSQELSRGTSIAYPIMIKNNMGTSKTYTLTVSGATNWGTARIDPSAVVIVPAGQTKTVYLYVSANSNAEVGDKIMTLTVDSGTESKQIPLVAKIGSNTNSTNLSGFRTGLEIGLIVLVIILIIIGLVIAFNKMKDNKKETEPYY